MDNSNKPPLKVTGLSKNFGSFKAVDQASFTVTDQQIFGFLGPNGAGKSTTIRAILNFIKPSSGKVEVFGINSQMQPVKAIQNIGYLAGDVSLYDQLSGKQAISYQLGLGRKINKEYLSMLLERLDIQMNKKIGQLSKGNKQKIGIMLAFAHQPKLLILDEPTSGLDPLVKQAFYDLLEDVKSAGASVFVSSHDLVEVQKICDQAAFIKDGQIIAVEDVKALKQIALRRFLVRFGSKTAASKFKPVSKQIFVEEIDQTTRLVQISGNYKKLFAALAKLNVVDLDEQETSLEDIFLTHYQTKGDQS